MGLFKKTERDKNKPKFDDIKVQQATLETSLTRILEINSGRGKLLNPSLPTIAVRGYTKKFKNFIAAENVTFNVGHGVIHGFIGPNGSGKTTTIKAMIGAYVPTAGHITINGFKAGSTTANQLIGYIPERASFPSHLNTLQYLTAMGMLSGLRSHVAKKHASEILLALGLERHARRNPTKFSSGMQKKILLAQSLMTDPKILILDEPAANLDPTARKELFDQLIELRDQGKTILISSHILAELERLVDEVTFVYYGDVIFSGKVDVFNSQVADVFIKSTDNPKLTTFLVSHGFTVKGDQKTEIVIPKVARNKANDIFELLSKSEFTIISFRSNDLQSVYDRLIDEAIRNKRGHQGDTKGNKFVALDETRTAKEVNVLNNSTPAANLQKPSTSNLVKPTAEASSVNSPVAPAINGDKKEEVKITNHIVRRMVEEEKKK